MNKFGRSYRVNKPKAQKHPTSGVVHVVNSSNKRKQTIDTGKGSYTTTLHWLYLSEKASNTPRVVDIRCGRNGISWAELTVLLNATVYSVPTVGTNLKRKSDALNNSVLDLYSQGKHKMLDTTILSPSREYAFRIKRTVAVADRTTTKYNLKLKKRRCERVDSAKSSPPVRPELCT
jgi:hypothetical protein